MSTLKEPYRIEGKKTMAYEIAEQMDWTYPDWIIYPTGGGTGMVGMWKAFEELEQIGWVQPQRRPRMVSVQADGCAPIVRAFHDGSDKASPWEGASTVADGLRVPRAIGDFLILQSHSRERRHRALRVGRRDGRRHAGDWRQRRRQRGARRRRDVGRARAAPGTRDGQPHDCVVLLNTGGALKYLDALPQYVGAPFRPAKSSFIDPPESIR